MPELRDCKGKLKHFTPAGPEVDIYKIPFLDKARESARQKPLAAELAAGLHASTWHHKFFAYWAKLKQRGKRPIEA